MAARQKQERRIPNSKIRKEQILDRCKGLCTHCGKEIKIGEDFTVEHVIPLSKGGTNEFENLVSLCEDCNKEKGNDIVNAEYYAYAPKVVYEEIERRLSEYYENNDWLTRTNIFRNDRFTVPVTQTTPLRNGKVMTKKSSCEIKKISDEDCDAFFNEFNKYYFPDGLVEIEEDEKAEAAPLSDKYQVIYKGMPVMIFAYSLFLEPQACLWFKTFINPSMKWGPAARIILGECFNGIIDQFAESLEARGTKSTVVCYVEAMKVDKRGADFISYLGEHLWENGTCEIPSPAHAAYDGVCAPTFLGECIKDVSEFDDEGRRGFSTETFLKQEKLYRSQLKRRVNKNG